MIEFPEAYTIARQINTELTGKQIESAVRGNSPHKFAFYNRSEREYEEILHGKTIGEATANGSFILVKIEPGYTLILGCGGERITYHVSEKTLPKKFHLLLKFADNSYLTVTVQGWGFAQLIEEAEIANHQYVGVTAISPFSEEFTYEYFLSLFGKPDEKDSRCAKAFMLTKPGIWGVGNGTLQDILFRARIHPRRKLKDMSEEDRFHLYTATAETIRQATELGGRDTERDLYDKPGGYAKILDSKSVDQPCPNCGWPIAKINYLGGSAYFCPECQK